MSEELNEVEESEDIIEMETEYEETEEFEEISSEEVDKVIAALDTISQEVQSDNIRLYLDEASDRIFHLVYTDEDLEDDVLEEAA